MRTWHYELAFVSIVLCGTTFIFSNNLINWVTTIAIILTFQHAQISDRLQERQKVMEKPTVECYHKLNRLFIAKELVWISAFIIMHNYAAIIGSAMFFAYPYWRKVYRTIYPL
jgi:hypothetical protein